MKNSFFSIMILFLISLHGCALAPPYLSVTTARLYNLDRPEVINATFDPGGKGHGMIEAIAPDGERFRGEYSTLSGKSSTSGSAFVRTLQGYEWAQASSFSLHQPGKQFGSATLVGDKGTVIEILYAVDPYSGHGTGPGRDNKGNRYRVQF